MPGEFWFYFDLYARGRLVGRSRVFVIAGAASRTEACAQAELQWLETGALRGGAFERLDGAGGPPADAYVLRDHPDSPSGA